MKVAIDGRLNSHDRQVRWLVGAVLAGLRSMDLCWCRAFRPWGPPALLAVAVLRFELLYRASIRNV